MQMKIELFELKDIIKSLEDQVHSLDRTKKELSHDKKNRQRQLDNAEIKLNDAIMRLRDTELKEKECILLCEQYKREMDSKDKEMQYLQERIDRLSDPIAIKYEKDCLV